MALYSQKANFQSKGLRNKGHYLVGSSFVQEMAERTMSCICPVFTYSVIVCLADALCLVDTAHTNRDTGLL